MTAGTEVVCSDVVHKVEVEDKCVVGLDTSDLNNVGGNGNGNVGGDGAVNADVIGPKSDSADEVEQVQKEDLGVENNEMPIDPSTLENNGIVHESVTVKDAEVQAVKEEVTLTNGSTVDSPLGMWEEGDVVKRSDEVEEVNGSTIVEVFKEEVILTNGPTVDSSVVLENNGIAQASVDDHHDKVTGEEEAVVKRPDEVEEVNGMINVEAKTDDNGFGVKFDPESPMNPIESSQVTVFDSDPTIKPAEESKSQVAITQSVSMPDVIKTTDESLSIPSPVSDGDSEVTVNHGLESISNLIDKAECQVTVDGSESTGKSTEDVKCQVTVDVSESTGKITEDVECQATTDGLESSGSPIEDRECQVSVDESESMGSSVDNLQCPVSVDGSESGRNHTENIDSTVTVMESATKSEKRVETSEVNVEAEANHDCGGIKAEHQSESVSTPYPFENKKAEETLLGSGTESEENPGSVVVFSEAVDAPAIGKVEKFDGIVGPGEAQMSETEAVEHVLLESNAGQVEKFDGIVELGEAQMSETEAVEHVLESNAGQVEKFDGIVGLGEAQMSETEAVEHVLLESNAEKAKLGEQLENSVEGSSEKPVNSTESVKFEAKFEETKEQVKIEDEIQESQIVITDNVQNDLNLEDNAAQSANEAEEPLETETTNEPITDETLASQNEEVNSCIDETQTGILQKGSAEHAEILPSTDSVKSECKNGESPVEDRGDDLTVAEVEGKVEFVSHLVTRNSSAEGTDCGTGIENVAVCDDEQTETEVKDAPVEVESTLSFPDTYVNPGTVIEFGSIRHHETVPNIHNDDVIAVPDCVSGAKPVCVANSHNPEQHDESQGDRSSDKVSCPEVEDVDGIQSDELPTSSIDGSVTDAIDVQNEEAEVLPYNFLIRISRFDDEMFRDQIRSAQLQVEEKTRLRDEIRAEIHGKRARLKAHNEAFNAAKSEETAARRLVRLKRQEIDSVQSVINRVKNAMSVEDIDGRIYNMEHMIQHETLHLKDEKQFIREIKQLKTLRDQLASNMGSEEEVKQALEQKDQNEERMKILRKELDSLKDKVSKAEAAVTAVGKKYDEESRRERELQAQFRAADDVRQKAYAHLNSLKKQFYDKNKNFRKYKEHVMAARDFASRGDKDALHRLCANQVEAFMEQWNNNDEFRREYVNRCNMNANRRQRALDGRSLVPDEGSVVLPNNVNESVEKSLVSIPVEAKPVSVVPSVEDKHTLNKSTEKKNQTVKAKGVTKPTLVIAKNEVIIDDKEEEDKVTKEEMEFARKAEELRKEEIAAKLKEQRRLEEKAKAIEALERKKRNAEKAQLKAELRARKEAEQKEKEREKRLRKKEKKKAEGDHGEEAAANSESSNEATTKEMEVVKEKKKKPQKQPPHFFSKQLKPKPVPPPIANRNKKRWQQWGKLALAAVLILALFLLGNTGFFVNLRHLKANNGTN